MPWYNKFFEELFFGLFYFPLYILVINSVFIFFEGNLIVVVVSPESGLLLLDGAFALIDLGRPWSYLCEDILYGI